MKYINSIITILFAAVLFTACEDQPEKKKSGFGDINYKKEQKKEKKTKVASSEVEAEESEGAAGQSDEQIAVAKKLIASADESKVKAVDAKKLFKNYCAICHGRKGNMEINGSKDLSKTNTSLAQRVAQIYFGRGTMTPFKNIIKDEEIIAVAQYIDELKK